MKKIFIWVMTFALAFALSACGSPEEEQPEEQIDYEIALVTDEGLLMDGGYNQTAWETISEFGADNGISHKYYKASESTADACKETIEIAISKGAKVIIADGYSFEEAMLEKQAEHPDVKFIMIDADIDPDDAGKVNIEKNAVSIEFASEQAGYLAGYGAVVNGYTQLGFMGSDQGDMVTDYGYGFLQGAERAASEQNAAVNVKYHCCAAGEDRNTISEMASGWYVGGTEVIFACGTNAELPVIEAAEMTDKKVIASETDKKELSDTIITSATKSMASGIEIVLEQYQDDEFPGGKVIDYDASNEGIGLVLDSERLGNLQKFEYAAIVNEMGSGEVLVMNHTAGSIGALSLASTVVSQQ
ncbi:MAG: BMP family ABC transporter substrate-binding protein [Clostridiales bacterium]|nr:BMP family ABC transporter substrate-binding protein [Clostridiales bacterium]